MAKSKRIKYATDSDSDLGSVGDVINENEWKPMRQPETNPSVEIAVLLIIRRIVRRTDVQRCICGFITHYLCIHTHTQTHRHAHYYNFEMTFAVHNKLLCSPFCMLHI